ncbi:MAG: response regulator transcription factor [Filimonas sp.]|nr:response regulator transcription factor [Filimonas sp.]
MIKLAIADDHTLLRKALVNLINTFPDCEVTIETANGRELLEIMAQQQVLPHVAILDINMPELNGHATATAIATLYPSVQLLALSMMTDEVSILKMLHAGAKGYLLKECNPEELKNGIAHAARGEYFINELMNTQLNKSVPKAISEDGASLSEREKEFLKWSATDLTYKEIADKMFVSPRTIDSYRDTLFEKLQIKSRVGLAIYAIKQGWVTI